MAVVKLGKGKLGMILRPDIGGSVAALRWADQDLWRPASDATIAARNVFDTACYPLVPYSNRIANGRLRFRGREYLVKPNMPPHPHPLHGHAFQASWQVESASQSEAVLTFRYQGDDFPSAYEAVQRVSLADSAVTMALEVKNVGGEAMPAGLGLHPFFVKPKGTRLRTKVGGVWLSANNDGIPTEQVSVPAGWDFSSPREVDEVVLDHCFTGWKEQTAEVSWPELGLRARLTAQGPCEHVVIYIPAGQSFFCVEPVTNMNDGFNRFEAGESGTGTVVLNPGAELAISMTVVVDQV